MQAKTPSPERTSVSPWFLMTTIFITGNVVMMLEVVGTRVVGPYFGVGIYVWSALITVTLLALAAGYWLGGLWADNRRRPEFLYLAILLAAAATLLIPVLRNPVLTFAGQFGVRGGVLVGSTLLFGLPLFLLGMVSPYATKLFTDQFEKLGSRVGLLYAVSTLGSFLGTITMGFYLIPHFNLRVILLSLGLTLLLMPALYFLVYRRQKLGMAMTLLALGLAGAAALLSANSTVIRNDRVKLVYKTTSFYGEIKVVDFGAQRLLLVDGVTQSGELAATHQATPPYVKDMDLLISRFNPQARQALVLGLGGGNMIHALLDRGLEVDVVEIDPKIFDVATRFFGVDPRRAHITLNDGRRFIRACGKKYDVVVCNTFSGESFPTHMLTREFFEEVNRILAPNGIVALNFVGYIQGPHRAASASVFATLKSANVWCGAYFRDSKEKFGNIDFVAGRGPIPPEPADDPAWQDLKTRQVEIYGADQAVVCTDDYNPVEFLNRVTYRRWRQMVIDYVGADVLLN
ncbi:MAG: fused MFS/spermidine synthase [candidate division FCPU426 bacterium]